MPYSELPCGLAEMVKKFFAVLMNLSFDHSQLRRREASVKRLTLAQIFLPVK